MAGDGKMFIILVMMCMTLKNYLICSFYGTKKVQYVERPQNLLGQPADLPQSASFHLGIRLMWFGLSLWCPLLLSDFG